MPSPICTVRDGGATAQATTAVYATMTPANTITIALADTTGVNTWSITCVYTDETSVAATVTAGLTINSVAKTATFTAPIAGKAYIFQSEVNDGLLNGVVEESYTTTFKVSTLTAGGFSVLATNETYEHSAQFGWTGAVNAVIRGATSVSRTPTLDANHQYAYWFDQSVGTVSLPNVGVGGVNPLIAGSATFPELETVGPFDAKTGAAFFLQQWIQFTSAVTAWPTSNYTFECALSNEITTAAMTIFDFPSSFTLQRTNTNTLALTASHTAGVSLTINNTTDARPHHIMITHSSTTNLLSFYYDGVLAGTVATTGVRQAPSRTPLIGVVNLGSPLARGLKMYFLALSDTVRPQSYARNFYKRMSGWASS